jgi:hypothetical protein
MEIIYSVNKIPIRLTDERWVHITEEHCELVGRKYEILETISKPDKILQGNNQELLAVKEVESTKFLIAVSKELTEFDGFLITAFLTRRINSLNKRTIVWP